MTRHSKNNTANAIFTYHERKKVKDFNTLKQRLASDSLRKFEQCWICLANAINPVSTPEGYIYCKECIIYSLTRQLQEYKEKLAKYEDQMQLYKARQLERGELEREELKRKALEHSVFGMATSKKQKSSQSDPIKNGFKSDPSDDFKATSFWLDDSRGSKGGEDLRFTLLEPQKPSKNLKCPTSGKPLKLKDLITVNPDVSHVDEDDPSSPTLWICSVSKKPISHQAAVLLKKTGQVVLKRFVGTLDDSDYINLISGGTGFASHNAVEATKYRPVMGS